MPALISVEKALELISAYTIQQTYETISLNAALGRTLAAPIIAKVSRPPAAVSAMDGYAVRLEDVSKPGAKLRVIGEAPAGMPFDTPVQPGEAVRIFTGGELPANTSHVIPQERTARDGDIVIMENAYSAPACVREAGLDFSKGEQLLPAGARIGPAELAIIAAANHGEVSARTRPRVALLANGDELKPPGSQLSRGQIVNSNPAALLALIAQWGGEPIDLGIAPDNLCAIQSFITSAEEADIIVPVGGASVGDHDYMRTAFSELGYENIFEKVAVKPGKPTWLASKGRQRVLGLPGNPASALVCAHLFLHPLIEPAHGHQMSTAKLATALPANGARTNYLRARVEIDKAGKLLATPADNQDSSMLSPFLSANCLILRKADAPALDPGAAIDILMIGPL